MLGFVTPDRDILEFMQRYEYATRLLGITRVSRAIFRELYLRDECLTVSELARQVGASRETVAKVIRRNAKEGYVSGGCRKWSISDVGSDMLIQVHSETVQISCGYQTGFSTELIRTFRDLGLPKIVPESSTICFEKKLSIFR